MKRKLDMNKNPTELKNTLLYRALSLPLFLSAPCLDPFVSHQTLHELCLLVSWVIVIVHYSSL